MGQQRILRKFSWTRKMECNFGNHYKKRMMCMDDDG